jgi:hypothetical protein
LKNRVGESWCQNHLADQQVYQLLEKVDGDLVEDARQHDCVHCGGKLHRSDYDRKPRGGPQWDVRFSLCCASEGCRRRHTPPSVRFMGRRVYAGLVVVLVSAMTHGLKPARVQRLREPAFRELQHPSPSFSTHRPPSNIVRTLITQIMRGSDGGTVVWR